MLERHLPVADHILIQLYNVDVTKLDDETALTALVNNMVTASNAIVIESIAHKFTPYGVSVIAMLEESHISIHTYPEYEMCFADIFVCGTEAKPYNALNILIKELKPRFTQINTIKRE